MDTKLFEQTLQTFGASPSHWETEQKDELVAWGKTDGAEIMRQEKDLDDCLNLLVPPVCDNLTEKIQALVINEKIQRQIVLFWKISPWISFLFMVCGFSLGWYQHHLDYINTQSYFNTMFDTFYEQY